MVKIYDDMLSHFHLIPERHGQTDRQTDGRTELLYHYHASACSRTMKTVAQLNADVCWRSVWTVPSQQYDRRKRWDLVSLWNVKSEEQAGVSGNRLFHAVAICGVWSVFLDWMTTGVVSISRVRYASCLRLWTSSLVVPTSQWSLSKKPYWHIYPTSSEMLWPCTIHRNWRALFHLLLIFDVKHA